MKRMILNSITSAQTLSFEELRKQARSYYLIEHEQQLPKLAINADKYYDSESQHTRDNSTNTKQDEWLSSLDNAQLICSPHGRVQNRLINKS